MDKKTVLVVDENRDVTNVISESLEAKGYKTYKLYNMLDAPVVFKEKREEIGLIILDMPIPGAASAVKVFFRLKDIDPDVEVIIISGFYDRESAKSKVKNEEISFIGKPFGVNDLVGLINEIKKALK